ncbi:hypothetical protein AB0M57_29760 [Streptomyces sp. NPDC051597]|uniref:hypothetical protein n=1 Tax=Streptomyces sp. NPDC051597 TaxID=3155049 RepID=UPI00342B83FA
MRTAITVITLASALSLFGSTAAHAEPLPPEPLPQIPEIKLPEIKLPDLPGVELPKFPGSLPTRS